MRLVMDLQGCETDSRDRGIGRYVMSFVRAVASRLEPMDELVLAVDMADPDRARALRSELRRRDIRARVVAYGYPVSSRMDIDPDKRRLAGQLRARFYAALDPDVLLIGSLFEFGTCFSAELDWSALAGVRTAVIGYDLIPLMFPKRYLVDGASFTNWYRNQLDSLRRFDLILAISEATKSDLVERLAIDAHRIVVIGAGFDATLVCPYDRSSGQEKLRELGIERPFVLMVGNGDWRKNTLGALEAFARLPAALQGGHDLVLTQIGDDVRLALQRYGAHLQERVHVLERVDDATLALLYRECRVMYFPSHYEGFGLPVLEAMAFGAPVLCSNAGALPEVVRDKDALFNSDSLDEGVGLLARALADENFRERMRHGAREHALAFTWSRVADKAVQALRGLAATAKSRVDSRADAWPGAQDIDLMARACRAAGDAGSVMLQDGLLAIARKGTPRVLVDISEIVRLDAKTGIQRVTRSFFAGLAAVAQAKGTFEVEPVCWHEGAIRYAREYARSELGVACPGQDAPVRVQPSDILFMLDSSWWSPGRFDALHSRVHEAGGEVVWMVYDLIPIRFPETCDPVMPPVFVEWLRHAVDTADGFVCISEATRADLEAYMDRVSRPGAVRPWTRTAYLGCDFHEPSELQISTQGNEIRSSLGGHPYFVALGTLEPRKDYATILRAFDLMWADGSDAALVMLGKQGWNVEALVDRINHHPEFGRKLHWSQGSGDGDVQYLLAGAAGLVQASIWEGFGLPLIEAGRLGVPLIASDIAVFHEIAGDAARYFPVGDAQALASVLSAVVARGGVDPTEQIRPLAWDEASGKLAELLIAA